MTKQAASTSKTAPSGVNTNSRPDITKSIYTPAAFAQHTKHAVDESKKKEGTGMPLCLPAFGEGPDAYFAPVYYGHMTAIIGQTSNGKSMLMKDLEANHADYITNSRPSEPGKPPRDILIHISHENSLEEDGFGEIARYSGISVRDITSNNIQDWNAVSRALDKMATVPIVRIGDSSAHPELVPYMSITVMEQAIRFITSGELLPFVPIVRGIYVDYLQAFPIDQMFMKSNPDQQRRLQVRQDVYSLYKWAMLCKCPVWVAVQAKQTLTGHKPPMMIPGVYDGEETSAIGQRADRVIGIWMPKTTNTPGERITKGQISFTVEENMALIGITKQRGNHPAGMVFPLGMDFNTGKFSFAPSIFGGRK